MATFYSPLDYVQENGNYLVGSWTANRGEACNGPWTRNAVRTGSILSRSEERCASGYAGTIKVIQVRNGTIIEFLDGEEEIQPE